MANNIQIEQYIPFGRDNAVTRVQLRAMTGLSDRDVRLHIESARRNGVLIINLQDGTGYFQPTTDDYELVKKQYYAQKSRAMKILEGNKSASQWLKRVEGQIAWE